MTFFVAESPERHVWGPVLVSKGTWHTAIAEPRLQMALAGASQTWVLTGAKRSSGTGV